MSGNAHESEVKAGLAAGFDDYISKPLLLPEFIEKVDYFYIKEQNKNNIHKTLHIQHLIEKCPNDANLGAEIRKYYNKLNTNSIG